MALQTPLYMQPATGDPAIQYTAQQDRAGLLGMTFSREGVHDLRGGHLKVTQRAAGANFTVDVAAGRCAIQGDDISDQGMYICNSTTVVSVTVPAKPASGSRTHRVVARIRDKLSNGTWSQYDWSIELLADTGSGTPVLPNSAITLATITVTSATVSITNGNIFDGRTRASTGTAAVEGTFALYTGFVQEDVGRPLRWSVNPDGWVQLSGFVRWTDATTNYPAKVQQPLGGTGITDAAAKPPGLRDFPGPSDNGPVHYMINSSGALHFRFQQAITLTNNSSWFSFDGCFYRI